MRSRVLQLFARGASAADVHEARELRSGAGRRSLGPASGAGGPGGSPAHSSGRGGGGSGAGGGGGGAGARRGVARAWPDLPSTAEWEEVDKELGAACNVAYHDHVPTLSAALWGGPGMGQGLCVCREGSAVVDGTGGRSGAALCWVGVGEWEGGAGR